MMNTHKKLAALLAAVIGLSALTGGTAVRAQTPPPIFGRVHSERHPELRAALRNLNQAKNNLQRAAHDYAGHREKALDLTQRAINEVQQALQSDRR